MARPCHTRQVALPLLQDVEALLREVGPLFSPYDLIFFKGTDPTLQPAHLVTPLLVLAAQTS